jgi:hypothetical protein
METLSGISIESRIVHCTKLILGTWHKIYKTLRSKMLFETLYSDILNVKGWREHVMRVMFHICNKLCYLKQACTYNYQFVSTINNIKFKMSHG